MNWFILLAVLNVADVLTTLAGLKRGASEVNPVMRALFAKLGPAPVLVAWKAIFLASLFYFLPVIDPRAPAGFFTSPTHKE